MKRPQTKKSEANREKERRRSPDASSSAIPPQSPDKARRRLWLYRTIAILLPLILVLGGFELALRTVGYGFSTKFFKPFRIGERDCLVENDKFGLRFFPPEISRSPSPVVMDAHKPPGTYRLFILGGSAALGDPDPAFGFGRYLEAMLEERFPHAHFEIVNVAMTAINSHVVLPIARECADHDGDLWIIYMGNNEMVGPFGAATVFGAKTPSLWSVRLGLELQRTRTGQFLMAMARRFRAGSHGPSWGGMQMFLHSQVAPDDPRKQTVYSSFRQNLEDILDAGQNAGVKMILTTVPVNLSDCPPFASESDTNLPPAKRLQFEKDYSDGTNAEQHAEFAQAVESYKRAGSLDPLCANLQFRLGQCLLHLTNQPAAHDCLQLACDDDALPFRADSKINSIIKETAQEHAGPELHLLDAEKQFAEASPVGISGKESFYEHVHLNFDGNYRLARLVAEQVKGLLPPAITNDAAPHWASQDDCERRLGLTDWNRTEVIENVIGRLHDPPFTGQENNMALREFYSDELTGLRDAMTVAAAAKAGAIYEQALKLAPDDYWLRENHAKFLEATAPLPEATREWERVRDLIPQHQLGYYETGRLLARQGKLADAEQQVAHALVLRPDMSAGWLELGEIHAAQNEYHQALKDFERCRRLAPEAAAVYFNIGKAYSKLKQSPRAIENFQEAIRRSPGFWEAHYSLGEELAFSGDTSHAVEEFETVLRMKPDYPMAHFNLGVALYKLGQVQQARQQLAETVRLDPQNKLAADYFKKLDSLPR